MMEECKNKVVLLCEPQLTVKLDSSNSFDQF